MFNAVRGMFLNILSTPGSLLKTVGNDYSHAYLTYGIVQA